MRGGAAPHALGWHGSHCRVCCDKGCCEIFRATSIVDLRSFLLLCVSARWCPRSMRWRAMRAEKLPSCGICGKRRPTEPSDTNADARCSQLFRGQVPREVKSTQLTFMDFVAIALFYSPRSGAPRSLGR